MPIIKKYNQDFFKNWSSDMAYVLGFLYADGNIVATKRGTHFIALHIADEELLVEIRRVCESAHKISRRSSASGNVFRFQIGSKVWFEDLCALGLTPSKSGRMRLPQIPNIYQGDFVRGYFDGDGNVWMGEAHKQRHTKHILLQVSFTSISKEFLFDLHKLLHNSGVVGGSLHTSRLRNFSRLSFASRDALTIYKIMYNRLHKLHLQRKKLVFEKFGNCGGSSTG